MPIRTYNNCLYILLKTRISNPVSFNTNLISLTLGFKLINIHESIFKILLTEDDSEKNSFAGSNKSNKK